MSGNVKEFLGLVSSLYFFGKLKLGEIVERKGKELGKLLDFGGQIKNSKTLAKTSSGVST